MEDSPGQDQSEKIFTQFGKCLGLGKNHTPASNTKKIETNFLSKYFPNLFN